MLKQFLLLEWKQFRRSSAFGQSLAVKIFSIIGILYFGAIFALLGVIAFYAVQEEMPGEDPLNIINGFLVYWFVFEVIYRFFLQKMPSVNIKPLMTLPIPKSKIIHYLLGKTLTSFFNVIPLFFYIPFTVVLLIEGYSPIGAIAWLIAMLSIEGIINFINFLTNKTTAWFVGIAVLLIVLIGLQLYEIFPVNDLFGSVFDSLYSMPYLIVIPLGILALVYFLNYRYVSKDFYIDERLSSRSKEVETSELNWLDRFGSMSTFLKNDLRLIWRNKRPKQVLWMAIFFLFYGLIFFNDERYTESTFMMVFAATFVTGGFLFSFGQLVPSWDSQYYKLLMSQNIPYRQYIESKWLLMAVSTAIALVLCTPYIYFGKKIYLLIVATALFNMGVNSFITILGGVYNRIPVNLNVKAKAFDNWKGFSFKQAMIGIPKILSPVLIFYPIEFFTNFEIATYALGGVGILGLALRKVIMKELEKIYQDSKYEMITAYSEKD